ncbi:hypothetical protein A3B84_02120 [Candidatus Nomurabacteria bacterium RIFCSPHIGHO2_02_FULL_35_13]|uniref:Uncharacterized protein n=1 Tax=Candidatus Nomurabacteria bacterium RIFCSPHIGHO2_02_FULL_35_13 TaxID=1801748 RepID=A0A1F6VQ73_9BACT|nr:MAG: hypothetical protein A3B84_02120 [Candidatus Nomurabacteria bacterium RIFCSPHIGHO2_02_FULL_35_13]
MINQQLVDFIKQQLQAGLTKEKISSELLANGWNSQDVEEGFNTVTVSASTLPPAPTPVSNFSPININPVSFTQSEPQSQPTSVKIKSIFSKSIFLFALILFLLVGGISTYYFKDEIIKLPVIKDFFPNITALQDVPVQTVDTQTVTQTEQPDNINQNSSLSIYNDPNGLYSFSYPKEAEIEYNSSGIPSVYMRIRQWDSYPIIYILPDINDTMFSSIFTDKNKYTKSSFGSISTYPSYKYTDLSKDPSDVYSVTYVIDLGSYNNTKLSILFNLLSDTYILKEAEKIEEIVKSLVINKNNIVSMTNTLLVKLNAMQKMQKELGDNGIKDDLNNIRVSAEVYYNKSNSYAGFCASSDYENAKKGFTQPVTLSCKDSVTAFASSVVLSTGYWCVDNLGYSGTSKSLNTGPTCIK